MNAWPEHNAKAHFSDLLNTCINEGPQLLMRHGEEVAVLVPVAEWRRLSSAARPSPKELLLSDAGRVDLDLPVRKAARRRPVTGL